MNIWNVENLPLSAEYKTYKCEIRNYCVLCANAKWFSKRAQNFFLICAANSNSL